MEILEFVNWMTIGLDEVMLFSQLFFEYLSVRFACEQFAHRFHLIFVEHRPRQVEYLAHIVTQAFRRGLQVVHCVQIGHVSRTNALLVEHERIAHFYQTVIFKLRQFGIAANQCELVFVNFVLQVVQLDRIR